MVQEVQICAKSRVDNSNFKSSVLCKHALPVHSTPDGNYSESVRSNYHSHGIDVTNRMGRRLSSFQTAIVVLHALNTFEQSLERVKLPVKLSLERAF